MANDVLKTLTIGGVPMDVPEAGENLEVDASGLLKIISSPDFKGVPTAPTNGTASTSNTQIATTKFVQDAINRRLPKSMSAGSIALFGMENATHTYTPYFYTAPNAGTTFLQVQIVFNANATGTREIAIHQGSSGIGSEMRVLAANKDTTILSLFAMARSAQGSSYRVRGWQNCGGGLQAQGYWFAYHITD